MIIKDDTKELQYQPKNNPGIRENKYNYKSGQRKLLVTEIEFLTLYGHLSDTVLYIGSAPGHHLDTLIDCFPNIKKWIFYDPSDTVCKNSMKVEKHKKFFTPKIALEFNGKNVLFISDIRGFTKSCKQDIKVADNTIINDMETQKLMVKNSNFVMSSLKFRLPWEANSDITEYFDGDLHTTPWLGEFSPELRLFTDGKLYKNYSNKKIDNQLYWYNCEQRRQLYPELKSNYIEHDYDQLEECRIVKNYLKQKLGDTPDLDEKVQSFIKTKCSIYKPTYRY